MTKLLILLLLLLPLSASADWIDGGLEQPGNSSGNGDMITVGSTLIFWNGTLGIVRSTDNGQTWQDVDPADNNSQGGFVAKFAASNGKIWAARSYGSGQGALTVSTDDGLTWQFDTVGSQPHALGWGGYAVISDMYSWDGYLFVKWDAPDAYDIRKPDGTYTRPSYWTANDPHSVVAIGSTLYSISNGLSFTTDYGVTWQKTANAGFPMSGTTLQSDGERLYILGTTGFNQPNHLWYSDDKGESWTMISAAGISDRTGLGGTYTSITAHFAKGENLYLGTQPTQYFGSRPNVFRSTNGGITWFVDTTGLGVPYYSSVIGFNYHTDGHVWVIPGLDGVYKQKLDNGGGGGGGLAGSAKLLSPRTGSVLQDAEVRFVWSSVAGATKYQIQVSTTVDFATLVHNDSSVTDTTKVITLTAGNQYFWRVRGIAPDKIKPKGGGIVQKLSGWSTGMFSISIDRSGWESMGISGILEMTMHKGAIYLATDKGIIKSGDGKSWTAIPSNGLDSMTTTMIVSAGDRLYVSAYDPQGEPYYFMYTTNDGATWITDTGGMTDASYVDGLIYFAGHLFVEKGGTGQMFYKAIDGPTWIEDMTSKGLNYVANGSVLFTDGGMTGMGYQKSTDFGATWQPITGPMTGPDGQEGMYAFDGKLYVFTQEDSPFDSISMFVSADNGDSWTAKPLGSFAAPDAIPFGNQLHVSSFLVDGDRMWISVEYGRDLDVVYRSLDAGATWKIDTAGAWEQFKGAHFNHMLIKDGTIWAISGGPEMGPGTLYRQIIDASEAPALAAPTLLSPADGEYMSNTTFNYEWRSVEGATSYQIQVGFQGFQFVAMNDSAITGTIHANTIKNAPAPMLWRVRALNGEMLGPWSSQWDIRFPMLDVKDEAKHSDVLVYPNPANGRVSVSSSNALIKRITLVDVRGIEMRSTLTTSNIDVAGINPGSYTLLIELSNGQQVVRKLIVE